MRFELENNPEQESELAQRFSALPKLKVPKKKEKKDRTWIHCIFLFWFCLSHAKKLVEEHTCRHTPFRGSIVVSIPACHAGDPGSIPGLGVLL